MDMEPLSILIQKYQHEEFFCLSFLQADKQFLFFRFQARHKEELQHLLEVLSTRVVSAWQQDFPEIQNYTGQFLDRYMGWPDHTCGVDNLWP